MIKRFMGLVAGGGTEPTDRTFLAVCAVIAFVGGGVKAVIHRSPKTTKTDIVAAAAASMVAGFSVGSLLLYTWGHDKALLIMPIVAVAGWIGIVLLDLAAGTALRSIRRQLDKDKE